MRLTDSQLVLSIADVCGKGLPAALLMSNLIASLRAFAGAHRSPREVVASTNRALCRQKDLRRFVTLFFATYDAATRRLAYTNAGHNPPLVVRQDGSLTRLGTGGTVAGVLDEVTYEEETVELHPGDRVLLFTDGLTEARSDAGDEFEEAGLLRTLARVRRRDARAIVDAVFDDVTAFAGGRLQDDATALVMAIG
jgi:sigma-B regulation protein RsbU (phosphoserine phosphatase)